MTGAWKRPIVRPRGSRRDGLFVLAALLGLLCALSDCGVSKGAPLPEVAGELPLNMYQRLAMMSIVRKAFRAYPVIEKLKDIPSEPLIPDTGGQPVFVSIFHKASPMIWGVGLEGGTHERILGAAAMIMRNKTFEKYYMVDRERIAVKIDVLTHMSPLQVKRDGQGDAVEPGLHGLLLERGKQVFFQLPTDYIMLGWEEEGYGVRDRKLRMLAELSEQAGIGGKGWRNYNVYRFRTISFLQEAPDYAPVPLFRGNPADKKFTIQDVQDAALKAGRQIQTNVQPSGRFRFEYDPIRNESSGFLDYDPTGHAASLYALSVLFQYGKRMETIEQTRQPLLWLVHHLETPRMEPEAIGVRYFFNMKTNASAMTLLALTAMPRKVMEELGAARVNRLASFLTVLQGDDGRFFPGHYHRLAGFMPRKMPFYLDGLALTALARYYRINPNVEWLAAAKAAAERQLAEFEKTGDVDTWTVQGLYDLWKVDKDERYAKAVFAMADKLLQHQFTSESKTYIDYVGGYDNNRPPKIFSTAIRTEAVYAAYRLAKDMGLDYGKYQEAVLRSTGFLMNNQFTKQSAYYHVLPDEAAGGFRISLVDNRIVLQGHEHGLLALCDAFDVENEILQKKKAEFEAKGIASGWKKMDPEELKKQKEKAAAMKSKMNPGQKPGAQ